MQDTPSLEVAVDRHSVEVVDESTSILAQHLGDLLRPPYEELPFLPFAVRVLRGVEPTLRRGHLPNDVVQRLLDDPPVHGVPRDLVGVEVQPCQERVVIEHLLEVGDEPVGIGRVPVEPSTQLIVDAASCHPVEGQLHHFEYGGVFGAEVLTKQELQGHRLRELGLQSEPTVRVVKLLAQLTHRIGHDDVSQWLDAGRAPGHLPHVRDQLRRGVGDVPSAITVYVRHRGQHAGERWQAAPFVGWEVGASIERLAVRREEDGHRPSALARHRLDRRHVDRVDVRALFPVHLDGDEVLVHQGGDGVVLERLPLHDVAPVARGIAHAKKDRFVLADGAFEGLRPPRVPVDRVVGVLAQVGTRLVDQSVWHVK